MKTKVCIALLQSIALFKGWGGPFLILILLMGHFAILQKPFSVRMVQ